MGESLAVVGNIDELGQWNDCNVCKMTWTENHVWVTDNLVVSKPFFLYKYVIIQDGEIKQWEKGANRIADLEVLPDVQAQSLSRINSVASFKSMRGARSSSPTNRQIKMVEIADEWEQFKIRFSIYDPVEENLLSQGDFMRIIGSTPKLGS